MYCAKCGNQIQESAKFCGKCGAEIIAKHNSEIQPREKSKTKQYDFKKSRNEIALYLLLFILGMVEIGSQDYMKSEYDTSDVGILSILVGTGLGNIFNSDTLAGIVVMTLNFIFSLSIIWLIVALVKYSHYRKAKKEHYSSVHLVSDFKFKKYFTIISAVLGVLFFIIFFLLYIGEETTSDSIIYSILGTLFMAVPLSLLFTIIIKWGKEILQKFKNAKNNTGGIVGEFKIKKILITISVISFVLFFFWLIGNEGGESTKEIKTPVVDNKKINEAIPVSKNENTKIQDVSASVVNIYCPLVGEDFSLESEGVSGGSGTIIDDNGLIITNSHVIPQSDDTLLTSELGCLVLLPNPTTGSPEEIYLAKPIVYEWFSEQYDLAYLKIYDVYIDEDGEQYGEYPKEFKAYKDSPFCDENNIKLGEPVRIYGYPSMSGGMSLTITDGIISSLPGEGLILTSAKIDAGNSGGLAVDSNNCILGIPSSVMTGEYENLGVIISKNLVNKFNKQMLEDLDN